MDGNQMYQLAQRLFPICRSITGEGVRATLNVLREYIPEIKIFEVPSGTKVFDWEVPKEWNIEDAWVKDPSGQKIIDFHRCNLEVVGYSLPLDEKWTLAQLLEHIYVQEDQPDVIPYVTSYYKARSGFCMKKRERDNLRDGIYHAHISSSLEDGALTYGELKIPATLESPDADKEIFFSTYICHPSMANNELSGPCMVTALAQWLLQRKQRRYSYRIIFVPETIGSITYLSFHLSEMKQKIVAGFNVSCVGDERAYSYIPSREGSTLADRVAQNVLSTTVHEFKTYTFLDRGSDERQYNAPGVDLPVCAICRSKYGEYPEYHTSADDLSLISAEGLEGALYVYQKCVEVLEHNYYYRTRYLCEPQLGKRGLYPTESFKGSAQQVKTMMDFLAYADGRRDLLDIGETIHAPYDTLIYIADLLEEKGVIEKRRCSN